MNFSFVEEGWTPNYVALKDSYKTPLGDMFLTYVENFIQLTKQENKIMITFDFGDKKIELPCVDVEELLYSLKQNEGNYDSDVLVIPKELVDFFGYFNLIEKTKQGYLMVEDYIKKTGNASLATLLGHILVEKHFPGKPKGASTV
jgi:hypothetical protein